MALFFGRHVHPVIARIRSGRHLDLPHERLHIDLVLQRSVKELPERPGFTLAEGKVRRHRSSR